MRQRFGTAGHRVWRLLQESPNQQMDAIKKSALLDLRQARHSTYSLYQRGYLKAQVRPLTRACACLTQLMHDP